MAISRRNILIGLGALVGGGGALVSTGAFSTVSAERSVEVSTAGDGSAFLTIDAASEYVESSGTDTFEFILGNPDDGGNENASGFNQNAITTLAEVATITNNAADGSTINVGLSDSGPSNNPTADTDSISVELDNATVTFYLGGINQTDAPPQLASGESTTVDVEVDTTGSHSGSSSDNLTIVAVSTSN